MDFFTNNNNQDKDTLPIVNNVINDKLHPQPKKKSLKVRQKIKILRSKTSDITVKTRNLNDRKIVIGIIKNWVLARIIRGIMSAFHFRIKESRRAHRLK